MRIDIELDGELSDEEQASVLQDVLNALVLNPAEFGFSIQTGGSVLKSGHESLWSGDWNPYGGGLIP